MNNIHPKKILQIVTMVAFCSLIISILAMVVIYTKNKEIESIMNKFNMENSNNTNKTDANPSVSPSIDIKAEKKKEAESSIGSSNPNDLNSKRNLYFLSLGLENYYKENKSYPVSNSPVYVDGENSPLAKLVPKYLSRIYLRAPKDSHFTYSSDGKNYELSAVLENKDDQWCAMKDGSCVYAIKNGVVESKR